MATHTKKVQKLLKIHQQLINRGYCPIPLQKKKQDPRIYLRAEKCNYRLDNARDIPYCKKNYYASTAEPEVGLLLDGKLALLDFDDETDPHLVDRFEEEFPFLKECGKDRNPNKPHSFHLYLPDDKIFMGHTGTGQITGKMKGVHLLRLGTTDHQSIKVDFKKVSKQGDEKTSTPYGGAYTPTISTYSCREMLRELPDYSTMLKLKETDSFKKFVEYMKNVYSVRRVTMEDEYGPNPDEPEPFEPIDSFQSNENVNLEEFKQLPVFKKYISKEFPEKKGFRYGITQQKSGIWFIDMGKSENARTCPFTCRVHKKNNFWLMYYPKIKKLVQRCWGCGGESRELIWDDGGDLIDIFRRGCNKHCYTKDGTLIPGMEPNVDPDLDAGKAAVMVELKDHLCFIQGQGKSLYIIHGYGDAHICKDKTGLLEYYEDEGGIYYYKEFLGKKKGIPQYKQKEYTFEPIKKIWLKTKNKKHTPKDRKNRIDFKPISDYDDGGRMFNTFKGFNITREVVQAYVEYHKLSDEDCLHKIKPWLDHINTIWCHKKKKPYEYILNWFSQTIQKPHDKTKVCICVKSDTEGAGKGCVLKALEQIIGSEHYVSLDDFPEGFNAVMADRCLINLDEAIFGGDKRIAGKIKHFITETSQQIKRKFKDDYAQESCHNIIISTNELFFAPIDFGSRRYCCYDLDNRFAGISTPESVAYFTPIWDVPAELIAKFLYERNIEDFNPKIFTESKLLGDVALVGCSNVAAWYHKCLSDKYFWIDKSSIWDPDIKEKVETTFMVGFSQHPDDVDKDYYDEKAVTHAPRADSTCRPREDYLQHYCEWAKCDYQKGKRQTQFWSELYKCVPKEKVDAGQKIEFGRRRCLDFPDIERCRSWWKSGWVEDDGTIHNGKKCGFDDEWEEPKVKNGFIKKRRSILSKKKNNVYLNSDSEEEKSDGEEEMAEINYVI
jgi:hypothetical protein